MTTGKSFRERASFERDAAESFKRGCLGPTEFAAKREYPLTDDRVCDRPGAGQRLAERDENASVVIGQDTRESSAGISEMLSAGLAASR